MTLAKPALKVTDYKSNKNVEFKKIDSIFLEHFRSFKNRSLILGENITLISGKNGTMKSSVLGLIAHPFSSPNKAQDMYGKPLKTTMSDVFRLSLEKDIDSYKYYLQATTKDDNKISEPIRVYQLKSERRHRIIVGGSGKNQGNFYLNTAYLNLKRLYPIIETKAKVAKLEYLTDQDKKHITDAYYQIMTRDSFSDFDCISDAKDKNTFGPKNSSYDFNTISSGEDNLGNILVKMLAFEKNMFSEDSLNGIFCIDEIEASLHPVALTNLFDYLLKWSKKNKIQIVATTHSLYLIQHALNKKDNPQNKHSIALNIISTAGVGTDENYNILNNPNYRFAYKELTLNSLTSPTAPKVIILCEDDTAKEFIQRLLTKNEINRQLDFIHNLDGNPQNTGTSHTFLASFAKNAASLFKDNTIFLVDPDVANKEVEKAEKSGSAIFKIPTIYNNQNGTDCCIEVSVIKFIGNLEGDHTFFSKREKLSFLDSFNNFRINPKKDFSSATAKNWIKQNRPDFKKALNIYAKSNDFNEFKIKLLNSINDKRKNFGLPPLSF